MTPSVFSFLLQCHIDLLTISFCP